MKRDFNLLAAAFALTAVSYGLARFAFGLLLPQMRDELSLDITTTGWIGSSAFIAYCVGIVAAFACGRLYSPRTIAFAAGLCSTIGMATIVSAKSSLPLGIGIALAGLSTGLTSPPLATAVSMQFADANRPRANAIINAGTAAGIVFSGFASLTDAGGWREIYMAFAVIGFVVTVWVFYAVPTTVERASAMSISVAYLKRPGMPALCVGAFLLGVSSTAIWTFGSNILREVFEFSETDVGWVWIALGLAGVIGAMTGMLTQKFGVARVHRVSLVGMALGILGLSAASISIVPVFFSVAAFGASYITSSGVFLIQGIRLLPERPDLGLGVPFLIVALGQSSGAPLFAALLENVGVSIALATFSGAALLASFIPLRRPGEKRS
jgi:predicted MFS family arabinose efflux permease